MSALSATPSDESLLGRRFPGLMIEVPRTREPSVRRRLVRRQIGPYGGNNEL
jgi:hypothetical protein